MYSYFIPSTALSPLYPILYTSVPQGRYDHHLKMRKTEQTKVNPRT